MEGLTNAHTRQPEPTTMHLRPVPWQLRTESASWSDEAVSHYVLPCYR
eukprot:COSAG02_NODE_7784_length_2846_cov_4.121587_3_plen_48_part_00